MKRVLRWAFNGVVAVSLLLCVGLSLLWVRSNDLHEEFRWEGKTAAGYEFRFVTSHAGVVNVGRWRVAVRPTLPAPYTPYSYTGYPTISESPPLLEIEWTKEGDRPLVAKFVRSPPVPASDYTAIPLHGGRPLGTRMPPLPFFDPFRTRTYVSFLPGGDGGDVVTNPLAEEAWEHFGCVFHHQQGTLLSIGLHLPGRRDSDGPTEVGVVTEDFVGLRLPYGALVTAAALLPVAWASMRAGRALRRRRDDRRRARFGLCRACGYNLTANVSGVCPECGKAVAAESAKGVA